MKKITLEQERRPGMFILILVYLPIIHLARNTSRQESTVHSPFEVMFGHVARLPIEVDQESEDSSKFRENYLEQPKVHV